GPRRQIIPGERRVVARKGDARHDLGERRIAGGDAWQRRAPLPVVANAEIDRDAVQRQAVARIDVEVLNPIAAIALAEDLSAQIVACLLEAKNSVPRPQILRVRIRLAVTGAV